MHEHEGQFGGESRRCGSAVREELMGIAAMTVDGLYALASLDGAPLPMSDRRTLGLTRDTDDRMLLVTREGGEAIDGVDHALLGHIDERDALAAMLGLPLATPSATLARAALARFGDDAPSHMLGEWTYAAWDSDSATLTLMASDTLRDRLLFASDGRRVAVAPHIAALARLDWVESAPDTANLLLYIGRAPMRGTIGDRTMLRDVRRVTAGTCVRISRAGVRTSVRAPLPAPTPWRGNFADAVDALDALLRRISREQMTRHPSSAVLLSGGLDSSLTTVFAAAERGAGTLIALTSAAPVGSGLPDETAFARQVADQAGIAMRSVIPATDADPFRPADAMLRWLQHPVMSPRHYLYDSLYREALAHGADAVLDGCEGEWSVTAYPDGLGLRQRMRDGLFGLAGRLAARSPQDGFQVQLSSSALRIAERELRPALHVPSAATKIHRRDEMWGYSPSIVQSLNETTTTPMPGLRRLLPLRDRRLLMLFAGLPYRFVTEGGVNRAVGRALLAGKVPDTVRLRTRGMPFSPDYVRRIHRHAQSTRERLPDYVRAGVGEWLDLAWLDGALGTIAARPEVSYDLIFRAQATAMTAAFLSHWLDDIRA